jgi:hypothetical protein
MFQLGLAFNRHGPGLRRNLLRASERGVKDDAAKREHRNGRYPDGAHDRLRVLAPWSSNTQMHP